MKVGDLVRFKDDWRHKILAIIVEIPLTDCYWGDTAIVQWLNNGYREEATWESLEVVNENR